MSAIFKSPTSHVGSPDTAGVSENSVAREKTVFGNETVDEIMALKSVYLNGTNVTKVVTRGSITSSRSIIEREIVADGSANFDKTKCLGKVNIGGSINAGELTAHELVAGGSIELTSSKVIGLVKAGGLITASKCEKLGSVHAGGVVNIDQCSSVDSVWGAASVTLQESFVSGSVTSKNLAFIKKSTIHGNLTCSGDRLVIEDSKIDTIELRCAQNIILLMGGVSHGSGILSDASFGAGSAGNVKDLKQTLELRGNSMVVNVIFEGGNGEVILSQGSLLIGAVTGGDVKE